PRHGDGASLAPQGRRPTEEVLKLTAAPALMPSAPTPSPPPDSDFYRYRELLAPNEQAIVEKVRTFMDSKVAPIINKYWIEDAFPFELLPEVKALGPAGQGIEGYGCAGGTQLFVGLIAMEMGRVDASFATFYGVHSGLAMGSIALGGSEEQK